MSQDSLKPLYISVVIPAHNAAKSIGRTLDSIYKSDISSYSFEVIVVNNASTDNTAEVASKFPVRLIVEPKKGRAEARNRGIQEAKGHWVVFMDADTFLSPTWFNDTFKQLPALPLIGGGQGDIQAVDSTGKAFAEKRNLLDYPTTTPCIDTAACFYLRHALLQVKGFDEALPRCQDIDLSRRISYAGYVLVTNRSLAFCIEEKLKGFKRYLYYKELAQGENLFNLKWQAELIPSPKLWHHKRNLLSSIFLICIWQFTRYKLKLAVTPKFLKELPVRTNRNLASWNVGLNKVLVWRESSLYVSDLVTNELVILENEVFDYFQSQLNDTNHPKDSDLEQVIRFILEN